jgi:hypothetical protein
MSSLTKFTMDVFLIIYELGYWNGMVLNDLNGMIVISTEFMHA